METTVTASYVSSMCEAKTKNMRPFFIGNKMYIATTTVGNYSKVLKQIIADWGKRFVFYKERSKTKIGTLPFPARVELSFLVPCLYLIEQY